MRFPGRPSPPVPVRTTRFRSREIAGDREAPAPPASAAAAAAEDDDDDDEEEDPDDDNGGCDRSRSRHSYRYFRRRRCPAVDHPRL